MSELTSALIYDILQTWDRGVSGTYFLAALLSQHLRASLSPQVPHSLAWLQVQVARRPGAPAGHRHSPGLAQLSAPLPPASLRGESHAVPGSALAQSRGKSPIAGWGAWRDQGPRSHGWPGMKGLRALLGSERSQAGSAQTQGVEKRQYNSSHSQILRKPGRTEKPAGGKPSW